MPLSMEDAVELFAFVPVDTHLLDVEYFESLDLVPVGNQDWSAEDPDEDFGLTEDYCEFCGSPFACLERDGQTLCPECRDLTPQQRWERAVDEHRDGYRSSCRTCHAHLEGVERRDGWCPNCIPF